MKQKNEVWREIFFKIIGLFAISIMLFALDCEQVMKTMKLKERVAFYMDIRRGLIGVLGIEAVLIIINQRTKSKIEKKIFLNIMFFIIMSIIKLYITVY